MGTTSEPVLGGIVEGHTTEPAGLGAAGVVAEFAGFLKVFAGEVGIDQGADAFVGEDGAVVAGEGESVGAGVFKKGDDGLEIGV